MSSFAQAAAATTVAALAVSTGLVAAPAAASSSQYWHCSTWGRIAPGVNVSVRSCIRLRPAQGSDATVEGRFEIRNRTARRHAASYFPQAEAKNGTGNPTTTQMGGARRVTVSAHHTGVYNVSTTTPRAHTMWISVEYILFRKHSAVTFRDSPRVSPYWS